jgi:hypothetical protein
MLAATSKANFCMAPAHIVIIGRPFLHRRGDTVEASILLVLYLTLQSNFFATQRVRARNQSVTNTSCMDTSRSSHDRRAAEGADVLAVHAEERAETAMLNLVNPAVTGGRLG